MKSIVRTATILALAALFSVSCSSTPDRQWKRAVPGKIPFVIIPAENAGLQSALKAPYIPFLDDITSSAIPLLSEVAEAGGGELDLRAILLYPGTGDQLQPVWISSAPSGLASVFRNRYYRPFTQNEYSFRGIKIHRLQVSERTLFAAIHRGTLLLSESSLGVEDMLRGYLGDLPVLDLESLQAGPGSFVMNTPSLDRWVSQAVQIIHRPAVRGAFRGSRPVVFRVDSTGENSNLTLSMSGEMRIAPEDSATALVDALRSQNRPLVLDRYISSDAAAYGIFRQPPPSAPGGSPAGATPLDSTLVNNPAIYGTLSGALDSEFAMVMYAESGFESVGEHLFLRRMSDPAAFRKALDRLEGDGLIGRSDGTWSASGKVMAQLIGSELCTFRDYYIDLAGEAAVISKRKGLAEVVASDRNRRRVIFYEDNYTGIRERLPTEVSGLVVAGRDFQSYISSFLGPDNYLGLITDRFDLLSLSMSRDASGESLAINLETFNTQRRTAPYEENWIKPEIGSALSGRPVLADIGGSPRDEVIFSTQNGSVYALAASDGTEVMRVNTGGDTPVGSPVIYDWYGTGQNVILQAAGNKIYGWNDTGSPLPQFPLVLPEAISTPLTISDVDRNGLPEAVVGTSDRSLHALDGRGNNISGWPVSTNSSIRYKPLAAEVGGAPAVVAFSENAVHAWNSDGTPKSGYPKFINASLSGAPAHYEGHILGAAADGYLYAMGPQALFHDSLNAYNDFMDRPGAPEAVYVSNSSLSGTPSVGPFSVQAADTTFRESMILTASSGGSVFLYSLGGQLRFTESMGQPLSKTSTPFRADVNNDGRADVVALASFGRLYAWDTLTGERLTLPTAGMEYPVVANLDGDRYVELIAQTREGLRCWTLFGN